MDVRNGILLATWIHTAFDNYDITIYRKEDGTYFARTQTFSGDPELHAFDGKTLSLPQEKPYEWPREEFLKLHNQCFEDRTAVLQAQAEALELDDYDSAQTIAERTQSAIRIKEWVMSVKSESNMPFNRNAILNEKGNNSIRD